MKAEKTLNDEAQIRAMTEEWAEGVRTKDVDRIMKFYAKDIVLFDLAPPLQFVGADAYRKSLENWFPAFDGPIGFEFRDQQINVDGNVAFLHSVNHMSGKRKNGDEAEMWMRATVGFRKIDGKWLVVHEHVSVPFYMDGSDKAAVDLKP